MEKVAIAAVLLLMSCWASAEALHRHPDSARLASFDSGRRRPMLQTSQSNHWEERWYEQTLDHFTSRNATFQQRYMFAAQYWKGPQTGAPIFLYCGLEESIDGYYIHHGLMWDTASQFEALLIFPEHRYYGKSLPFGNLTDSESMMYLSSEQAIGDYVALITDVKTNLSAETSPVVLFGCSYGGMLASWFRLKYPHIAIGAIASSAPILMSEPSFQYIYNDKVAEDFRNTSEACYQTIKNSLNIISNVTTTEGLHNLSVQFGFCKDLKFSNILVNWIEIACSQTAQYDWPPKSAELGYPIEEMCKVVDQVGGGSDGLAGVAAAMKWYYNIDTRADQCFQLFVAPGNGRPIPGSERPGRTWEWQRCTEHVQYWSSRENTSMFPAYDYNLTYFENWCLDKYGVKPRHHWILEEFGGKDIGKALKQFGSNIVFANGLRDPYSGMGVLKDISESIVALVTEEGAHCVDMLSSDPSDPKWLVDQRLAEVDQIERWLRGYASVWNTTMQ